MKLGNPVRARDSPAADAASTSSLVLVCLSRKVKLQSSNCGQSSQTAAGERGEGRIHKREPRLRAKGDVKLGTLNAASKGEREKGEVRFGCRAAR